MTARGFAAATAVTADAAGHWRAEVDAGWFAPTGPNGGYLAAILLKALTEAVGDPVRRPRTLTVHYLRGAQPGPVEVIATVERTGRTVTQLSARLEQDGRLCCLALAAFATDQETTLAYAHPMPQVPGPEDVTRVRREDGPPIIQRLDIRPCLGGPPFKAADDGLTGGWLGFDEPHTADAPACACLLDAWWPAPWVRADHLVMAPTLEMTFHFRAALPHDLAPGMVLGRFDTRHAAGGFAEEEGLLFAPDGTLLAQSRQLAVLRG